MSNFITLLQSTLHEDSKSPHFPFYDFSTIFYEFTKFSQQLIFQEKEKDKNLSGP
jgi:hypothetical protein